MPAIYSRTLNRRNIRRIRQVPLDAYLHIGQYGELDRGEHVVRDALAEHNSRVAGMVRHQCQQARRVVFTRRVRYNERVPREGSRDLEEKGEQHCCRFAEASGELFRVASPRVFIL